VTVHDTATAPAGSFDANAAAKAAHATPFKRPENGVFRPGTSFREFYFDETGDTSATSPENATSGGWGSIMKLTQASPTAESGKLTLFYSSKQATAGLDNVQFLARDSLAAVAEAVPMGCGASPSRTPFVTTSPPTREPPSAHSRQDAQEDRAAAL
jgi:hypothetical protein